MTLVLAALTLSWEDLAAWWVSLCLAILTCPGFPATQANLIAGTTLKSAKGKPRHH